MAKPRRPYCGVCGAAKVQIGNGSLRCKPCARRRDRSYHRTSEETRSKDRSCYIMREYGLSLDDLHRLLAKQQERCAICKRHWRDCPAHRPSRYEDFFIQHLYIDHDHETGKVRGLLCHSCNVALGMLRDSPSVCRSAIKYLRSHKENDADEPVWVTLAGDKISFCG